MTFPRVRRCRSRTPLTTPCDSAFLVLSLVIIPSLLSKASFIGWRTVRSHEGYAAYFNAITCFAFHHSILLMMQKAHLKDAGDDPQPSRKRKVQWADEDEQDGKKLATTAFSETKPQDDDVDFASSHVDEHGMLVSGSTDPPRDPTSSAADTSNPEHKQYLASEIYNPIQYGDFGSYMKHKRAKLKVQEASLLQRKKRSYVFETRALPALARRTA